MLHVISFASPSTASESYYQVYLEDPEFPPSSSLYNGEYWNLENLLYNKIYLYALDTRKTRRIEEAVIQE
jgi:hypothetical protein